MSEEQTTPIRQTAKPCAVIDILQGEYVLQEGWQPNYVVTPYGSLTRINIMGLVVDKPTPYQFRIDDGTGSVLVTDFNHGKKTTQLTVGTPVLVVGRVRKANEEVFIAAEIVTSEQLKANHLFIVERKELLATRQTQSIQAAPEEQESTVHEPEKSEKSEKINSTISSAVEQLTGDDVVDFMKKKDTGSGVAIDDIIDYFGQDADDMILTMISMGEIYEIKPGIIKVLE